MAIAQFYCKIADTQLLTLVPTKRERGEDLNWVCREGLCKLAECVIPDILLLVHQAVLHRNIVYM